MRPLMKINSARMNLLRLHDIIGSRIGRRNHSHADCYFCHDFVFCLFLFPFCHRFGATPSDSSLRLFMPCYSNESCLIASELGQPCRDLGQLFAAQSYTRVRTCKRSRQIMSRWSLLCLRQRRTINGTLFT